MNDTPKLQRVVRFDNIPVDETYYTNEGFLIDHPIVTTVGIFEYMNPDGSTRRELRLPDEVFAPDSLASYEGKPIIITHNAGEITKENVEDEIIGTILSQAYRDGDDVRAKIVIHDTDKMKQSGLRELSLGYSLTLDETPGEWNGQPYDAIQRNIRVNHLALVSAARAGEQARLNIDGKEILTGGPVMEQNKQDSVLSPEELEAAIADFVAKKNAAAESNGDNAAAETTPPVTEEGAAPVVGNKTDVDDVVQSVKDRRDRRDAETASSTKETALEAIQQQDEDIDALLKLIDQLRAQNDFNAAANADEDDDENAGNKPNEGEAAKTDCDESKSGSLNMDAADIDRIVTARLDVIRVADKLHLDGVDTMPLMEGKKAVIKSVLPSIRFDGKSADYIDALYDLAKNKVEEDNNTDKQRRQMFNADTAAVAEPVSMAEQARAKMIKKQNGGN